MVGSTLALFVAGNIAGYGINYGLDKLFKKEDEFEDRLYQIINKVISMYDKELPQKDIGGKIPFYKSELLVSEFLKFRIYGLNGYAFDIEDIKSKIDNEPNIIIPKQDELNKFYEIFDAEIGKDEKLKKLQLNKDYQEVVFQINEKLNQIKKSIKNELFLAIGLLEEEYKQELQEWYSEINGFKPKTALKRLEKLERRITENSEHVSSKLIGSLFFLKAKCYEALGNTNDCHENFIKAYSKNPKNGQYLEKACFAYYYLNDDRCRGLLEKLEQYDEYNYICWAIKVFDSEDKISFLKNEVPKNVFEKDTFKRLVFNVNQKERLFASDQITSLLKISKLEREVPSNLKYEDFHMWVYYLNIAAHKVFMTCPISFAGSIEKNEDTLFAYHLLEKLSSSIVNSEISNDFNVIHFYYLWFQSELDCKENTISRLAECYEKLSSKESFITFLYANSVQKNENLENASKIIKNYGGVHDENLRALDVFCNIGNPNSMDLMESYFKSLEVVDEINIRRISAFIIGMRNMSFYAPERIKPLLKKIECTNTVFKDLLGLLLDSTNSNEKIPIERINKLRDDLGTLNYLQPFIASAYFENEYYKECANLLEPISEEEESVELYLYIKALNNDKSERQVELLRLLKVWRLNFSFNAYLLRIELDIRRILRDWEEILKICEYALSNLPNDEPIFTNYIIATDVLKGKAGIKTHLKRTIGFEFKSSENALIVANILAKNNCNDEALEMVYLKAKNENDVKARMNYLGLQIRSAKREEVIENVKEGNFVLLSIDGDDELIEVSGQNLQNQILQDIIGKKVNEEYSLITGFSGRIKRVLIKMIMNKYQALAYEIAKEAEKPSTNLPLETIKIRDKESFEKNFIENFGPHEENRNEKFEQNLIKYRTYRLSLMELTLSNFKASYIVAYYHLTSSQGGGFYIKPKKYFFNLNDLETDNFIVDFSSGLLFFELSKEFNLEFEKFIVSKNTILLIDSLIEEAVRDKDVKMSVAIKGGRIIPYFYDDAFHENRLQTLNKIKEWFQNHTDSVIPEEKLSVVRRLHEKGNVEPVLEVNIDNVFLAQRDNYTLISDDLIYSSGLHLDSGLISSELYLEKRLPKERRDEIFQFLLQKRYIGLTISPENLYRSYINQNKAGLPHVYEYALLNLSLRENWISSNINVIVAFLRKVALNPAISKEKYGFDATNLFATTIPNFTSPSLALILKREIEKEFKYLGDYLEITLAALLDALRYTRS